MFGFLKKKEAFSSTEFKSEPKMENKNLSVSIEYLETETNKTDFSIKEEVLNSNNYINPQPVQDNFKVTNREFKEELETHIGKLVICITNQIENPTIALGVEVISDEKDYQHKLFGYDIVRKEQVELSGIIFDYTEQKFDALNRIDPNSRIALFFNRLGNTTIEKQPSPSHELFSPKEWKEKVSVAIGRINRGEWT